MGNRDDSNALDIGNKLRAARVNQSLSLRELAAKAEVSASLLSQIENGKANPSVRSLHSIAEALSLSVDHFFPNKDAGEPLSRKVAAEGGNLTASQLRAIQEGTSGGAAAVEFEDEHTKGPLLRRDERPTIELEGGVTWARLTPNHEEGVEFLQICYDAGSTSGKKMSHHTAREFGLVLEGELLLELGFEKQLLKAGDSIIFDSTTPHRLTNAGEVPMRAIWVIFNRQ